MFQEIRVGTRSLLQVFYIKPEHPVDRMALRSPALMYTCS